MPDTADTTETKYDEAVERLQRDAREADRFVEARKTIESDGLQRLLEFLCSNRVDGRVGIRPCQRYPGREGSRWIPVSAAEWGERIFADFFDIDMEAVERHRRRVLGELSARHESKAR